MVSQRKRAGEMVDRLKSSTEHLEAPTCPDCHLEMKWFRSELVRESPTSVIAHEFVCPNCKRPDKIETKFNPIVVPPDKLSAPRFFADAA